MAEARDRRGKILVVTGKRGGFGALIPTLRELDSRPGVELVVVATDQHLYEDFEVPVSVECGGVAAHSVLHGAAVAALTGLWLNSRTSVPNRQSAAMPPQSSFLRRTNGTATAAISETAAAGTKLSPSSSWFSRAW